MKLAEEISSLDNFTELIDNKIIKNRVNHLLIWYVKKATYYKVAYYALSIIIIIINAGIPIINQLNWNKSTIIVSIISGVASIMASITTLLGIKDTWFRYRKHVELIKKECMLFNCKSDKYDGEDREKIFINNIENIITIERQQWETNKFKNSGEKS